MRTDPELGSHRTELPVRVRGAGSERTEQQVQFAVRAIPSILKPFRTKFRHEPLNLLNLHVTGSKLQELPEYLQVKQSLRHF